MAEEEQKAEDTPTPEQAPGTVAEPEAAAEPEPEAAAEPEATAEPEPEAAAEPEPETQAAAAPAPPAVPSAPRGAPVEVVPPKERRRRSRAAKAAKVKPRPPRTPEERHAERVAERRQKAELRRAGRAKAKAKATHHGAETTPPREHIAGTQKVRQGVVVSDKADKTITVRIDTARRHRRYQKIVRTSQTLHAHDERNDAGIGDTVIVRESRPLSRTKRWRLVEVVEKAK
jgi:small subunit ribosomal protein S17